MAFCLESRSGKHSRKHTYPVKVLVFGFDSRTLLVALDMLHGDFREIMSFGAISLRLEVFHSYQARASCGAPSRRTRHSGGLTNADNFMCGLNEKKGEGCRLQFRILVRIQIS